jgi:magnesium-transporting ATPase (P-type)
MADDSANGANGNGTGKVAWHALSTEDALERLGVDPKQGLGDDEVEKRREEHGENRLTPGSERSTLQRLISQFNNLFIYLLIIAAVVTALLGEWLDSGVIFAVVLIIAAIGFIQEGRAEKALESVQGILSQEAAARRGGRRRKIPAEELVPGDIVRLEAGDRVPADVRLLETRNLATQEAALTGESTPVGKGTEAVEEQAEIGDRRSMAYSGTVVTSGQATGVVVAIGDDSEIGKISGMLSEIEELKTPLMRRLDQFTKVLSIVIVALAALTFAIGTFVWGRDWTEMFFAAVSVAVAAIPEGLPAVMTVTLAIGVERMASRNAIIRRLPAVETLGSVTTICADKTGTLTRNEMTAKTVRTAQADYQVEGVGYGPDGEFSLDDETIDLEEHDLAREVIRAGLLCNDATVERKDDEWQPEGDPTEAALIVLARKAGFDPEAENGDYPRVDAIPFASERRYMATLNHDHHGNHVIYVKGAPERVLEMCTSELREDGEVGDFDADAWLERAEAIAGRGQRLLAAARKEVDEQHELDEDDVERDLVFLGLFGLIDPPREEAIESVAICKSAGIRVKIITGDHAKTASAVGGELGLANADDVLTGRELEKISDEDLKGHAKETDVFARASPEHKLRLVEALQAQGEIVAMTGDGVNDAPALKRADVGIAMGQKGTEAAREASEMVLADDNFASIERAVEEGRTVYDNLRKSILFLLPTNAAQGAIIIVAILAGFMLPVTPVQILWVNMVTAVTLGIAFAWEKAEGNLMERPPHPTDEALLTGYVIWRVLFVGALLLVGAGFLFLQEQARDDSSIAFARTVAVNALVMGQIFYLLNTRFFEAPAYTLDGLIGNRVVLLAIAICVALQLVFTYVPFMNTLFGTAPLDLVAWASCIAVGLAVFVLVEVEKLLVRKGLHPLAGTSRSPARDQEEEGEEARRGQRA